MKAADSKKEYERLLLLRRLEAAGVIRNLRSQVSYTIVFNNVKICRYVSDFVYDRDGVEIVEDVKSFVTKKLPAYRLKKKLMLAAFGIVIQEV